jgi:predicted nucleic acid-binding protein
MIYCDTSFLLPLYVPEDNWHVKATCYHERHLRNEAFCFNPWHRWELRHNCRQALPDESDVEKVFQRVQEDVADGKLRHVAFTWTDIFNRADSLSSIHARKMKAGTVDFWHVAVALEAKLKKFMTFDEEQFKLARAVGLDAPDLLRSGRAREQ